AHADRTVRTARGPGRALLNRHGGRRQSIRVGERVIRVSNLDKILYPETGTAKRDVLDYYARVAPVLLPHATRRPLTRKRWPDGVGTEYDPRQRCCRNSLEDSAPDWSPRIADGCRELRQGMGLESVPVTSGSKGIHVYAGLDGNDTSVQVSEVAQELARAL